MNKQATREAARNAEALERPIDEEPLNLIDRVEHEMRTDEEDREDQSARLLRIYETGSAEVRAALDDAFICLCGYSLETLTQDSAS